MVKTQEELWKDKFVDSEKYVVELSDRLERREATIGRLKDAIDALEEGLNKSKELLTGMLSDIRDII